MIVTTPQNARDFLLHAQPELEKNEAANNLMLGLALQWQQFPEKLKTKPYFATVWEEQELVIVAIMSPPQKLLLHGVRPDTRAAVALLAQDLFDNNWPVPCAFGPDDLAFQFAEAWARLSGASYTEGRRQRIYELRQVLPPPPCSGRLRLAVESDFDLIAQWSFAFNLEAFGAGDESEARAAAQDKISGRMIYIWEDERPVAMAAQSRPTANGACISYVYTPPEFRQRGYATNAVAALSRLLLDSGRKFCVLFTDLSNPTSNSIYQKIGYLPLRDFNEYVFRSSPDPNKP